MNKAALVILSDPKAGEEALGRLLNALAFAHDMKTRNQDVRIVFQGAGTRWPAHITKSEHPAHGLYKAVEDKVDGVSCGCADLFGARGAAVEQGFELLQDNAIPGTNGLASLARLAADGYAVITF
jgi:hypothetical protein